MFPGDQYVIICVEAFSRNWLGYFIPDTLEYFQDHYNTHITLPFSINWDKQVNNNIVSYLSSRALQASDASRSSSNMTKAKPGGFLATQTFLTGPYRLNASSSSVRLAPDGKFPTYTLHSNGTGEAPRLYLAMIEFVFCNKYKKQRSKFNCFYTCSIHLLYSGWDN